jgi:DNA replication ATP-dependent helicase Dna2
MRSSSIAMGLSVWSPMYGLKGNIDATVQVTMQDDQGERTLTVPFEVKTGKNASSSAHSVQTALYNLLLSNRYDIDVAYGMLYYLETSAIIRIPAVRNEIIHMLIQRNELACYVRDRIDLPPMLKEDFKCGNCYAQESCFLYNKLVEDGEGESLNKKAKQKYDDLVRALKPADRDFMKKWDTLLTKEETDMMKFRRELWTMISTEREKLGRCFSNVVLEPGSAHEEKLGQKINRYSYTFVKEQPDPGFSFTESQLAVGEPVVVSDEQGHFALANGYVTNVQKRRITVAVDRRLHNSRTKLPGFDAQSNQTFAGIMEVGKDADATPASEVDAEPVLYRLDKDEFSNGMAAARNNLIQIMDDNIYKARDLRALIVEGRAPVFRPVTTIDLPRSSQMSMNSDQQAAVAKVMSAKDYALVLGMPGTGKTTTIAHIIRTLVDQGKSVLLTSYTHTAVDNILLKMRDDKIGSRVRDAGSRAQRQCGGARGVMDEAARGRYYLPHHQPPTLQSPCVRLLHRR